MKNIKIIHGPNLNLLGKREVEIYSKITLDEINTKIIKHCKNKNINIEIFQSNHEGEIIDFIHQDHENFDGIVINPAGLTHYSISLRDAITAVNTTTIEVHLSNIFAREEFRAKSVISPVADGVISGLAYHGYLYAIDALLDIIKKGEK